MVEKKENPQVDLKSKILDSCNIDEFIEAKLKKYMPEISKHTKINIYDTVMESIEKALIKLTLKTTEGNQLWASKVLGISRNTLREKMKKFKLIEGDSKKASTKDLKKRRHGNK